MPDQSLINMLMGTWPARMGQGLLQGAMAPGNAWQSTPENPVTTEQMIGPAANLAGLAFTGGMPFSGIGALGATGGKGGIFPAYHGTGHVFDEFNVAAPKTTGGGLNDRGIFLTPDPKVASRYAESFGGPAPNVRMHNVQMNKPLEMEPSEFERLQDIANMHRRGQNLPEVKSIFLQDDLAKAGVNWDLQSHPIDAIQAAGFDGIIKKAHKYGAEPEYMVFDPNQIMPFGK